MSPAQQFDKISELKSELVRLIEEVHDVRILRGIKAVLSEFLPEDVYILNEDEIRTIVEAEARLDLGQGIVGHVVEKDNREWLKNLEKASK